jgi:hypothetical protein
MYVCMHACMYVHYECMNARVHAFAKPSNMSMYECGLVSCVHMDMSRVCVHLCVDVCMHVYIIHIKVELFLFLINVRK